MDKEVFIKNLTNNQIIFSIDGSFFPEKSHLVSAYNLASIDNKIVLYYKFIASITLNYYYFYIAELCGKLGINKFILFYACQWTLIPTF